MAKADTCQFELSSAPGTDGAAKYKVTVRILKGDESLRDLIRCRLTADKILHGLNLTAGAKQVPICEEILSDMPKALF